MTLRDLLECLLYVAEKLQDIICQIEFGASQQEVSFSGVSAVTAGKSGALSPDDEKKLQEIIRQNAGQV